MMEVSGVCLTDGLDPRVLLEEASPNIGPPPNSSSCRPHCVWEIKATTPLLLFTLWDVPCVKGSKGVGRLGVEGWLKEAAQAERQAEEVKRSQVFRDKNVTHTHTHTHTHTYTHTLISHSFPRLRIYKPGYLPHRE